MVNGLMRDGREAAQPANWGYGAGRTGAVSGRGLQGRAGSMAQGGTPPAKSRREGGWSVRMLCPEAKKSIWLDLRPSASSPMLRRDAGKLLGHSCESIFTQSSVHHWQLPRPFPNLAQFKLAYTEVVYQRRSSHRRGLLSNTGMNTMLLLAWLSVGPHSAQG